MIVGHHRSDLPSLAEHLPIPRSAIRFARHLHRDRRRVTDGAPVIAPPLDGASLLYSLGAAIRGGPGNRRVNVARVLV